MTHSTCNCPICPLVAANVQICDAIILVKREKRNGQTGYDLYSREKILSPIVKHCLTRMIHDMRESDDPIDVGQRRCYGNDNFDATITRTDELDYTLCFHTKQKQDDNTDPLPMD
jgi:hypothetical protein